MTDDFKPSDDAGDEDLPLKLREALARVGDHQVTIPPALDALILSRAKSDYAKRLRFRPAVRWMAACASVAAAIAVVFVLRATLWKPQAQLVKGDINGNGKVDMLDAYLLAKHLAAGDKIDPKWDMNGDGVVDQGDVDWIANHAVQLSISTNNTGGTQ